MLEISPCPFCGAALTAATFTASTKGSWGVKCIACEAEGPKADDDQVAISLWNERRAAPEKVTEGGGASEAMDRNRRVGEERLRQYRDSGGGPDYPGPKRS